MHFGSNGNFMTLTLARKVRATSTESLAPTIGSKTSSCRAYNIAGTVITQKNS
jgi:hypothetical protein